MGARPRRQPPLAALCLLLTLGSANSGKREKVFHSDFPLPARVTERREESGLPASFISRRVDPAASDPTGVRPGAFDAPSIQLY